jgi:putative membrane-bound dehydrogenase-like protein
MVPERQGDPSRAAEKNVLGAVKPAEGFEATAFAAPPAVNYPVFVSAAPDGTLYVASDGNGSLGRDPHRGRVVRLRDLDGDGRADESKLFVADLDSPRGMVWDQDRLYVLHPPHISAFIDKDGDGVADEQKVLVKDIAFNLKDRPADHTSNGLTLGADGWLYAAIGDFGFLKATGADGRTLQLRGGGVVRVRPDGTGLELFTSGTRNILEVALSPLLDGFARDNTNDGGGWDVRFHHFTGLEDHGYPRLYKNFADEAITPLADYGGGSGCGAAWLDDPGLPAAWNNRPFTSDWGRDVVYAHPVTASGSTFAEKSPPAEFVRLPRPTDLDIDAAGRVYVCSWRGGQFTWAGPDVGFIVRVTPKGFKPRAVPDFAKASDGELVKLLEDGSHRVRLEAQRRLLRHGLTDETTKALEGLASDKARSLATRVAALFALKQGLGEKSHAFLVRLADDPTVAAWAVRALTDHEGQLKDVPAEVLRKAAGSEDARTRREGIIALARLGDPANAADIAARLGDADGVIAHTAAHALARLRAVDACLAVLEKGTPTARRWAARALALMHDKRAVDGLVRLVEAQKDRGRRAEPLAALCRLYHREGDWKGDSWGTRPDTRGPYYQPEPWAETDRIGKVLLAQLDAADADEIVVLGKELARNRVPVGDPTGRLIELAKKSSEAARVLAREMADAPTVPPAAVPLLVELVRDDAGPSAAAGIVALAKADSADGVRASVHALTRLRPGDDANRAVRAFLTSPFLGRHVALLTETARTASPEPALWADAALLRLAAAPAADDARATAAKAFADDWKEPKRRSAILAAAARTGDRSRAGEIVAALDDADPGVRKAAADAVAKLALDPKRVKEVLAASGPKIGTMKPEAAVEAAEAGRGEAWRGEQLFVKLNCVACHTVSPEQPLRGPYLGTIAKTYRRKALAESILLPNKTIAQGFATNVFNLNDGRTLTGFVTQEAADKVTVRDNTGKEWVLPKKDIDERTKSPLSVMPEGLAAELTVTDFASLLDYLEALAAERGKP